MKVDWAMMALLARLDLICREDAIPFARFWVIVGLSFFLREKVCTKRRERASPLSPTTTTTSSSYFSTLAAATTMQEHHEVVIAGGGIGGLILALCLDAQYNHSPSTSTTTAPETNENKIEIHVYESASEFSPGAGGAIGLYANGLRVLRDLSNQHPLLTSLLDDVRTAVSTLKITVGK